MSIEVAIDSSVLVSASETDKFRPVARKVIERILSGRYKATTSGTVYVEVCASISRRAGPDLACDVKDQLAKWEEMNFLVYTELTTQRRKEAAQRLWTLV